MLTNAPQQQLHLIEEDTLNNIVRRALQNDRAVVESWHACELYGAGSGSRIYKVAGEASDQAEILPWSFVLKIFDQEGQGGIQAASADPAAWDYWKREWLAYQAPWVQSMGGSLAAPRCLDAGEQTGVAAWMALEDLSDLAEQPWSLARFHTVARHLGVFNGAYLAGQPMPEEAWLSRDWLRGWTERAGPMVALLPTVAGHPLVRQVFPESTITAFGELWNDRKAIFAALDRLPQTLCHRDIFPRNVFVRHTAAADQSVAIDWAFTGPGAVGEELAALVGASLAFFEAEPADAAKLEYRCLSGYLAGLRSAGWQGDIADVRFGYLATYVLRYALGTLVPVLPILLDESKHRWAEQIMRRPIAAIVENTRITAVFQEQCIAEVRALLAARQARG